MRPVDYIPRIRDNYARPGFKAYNWVINPDTAPWTPLRKPLSQCRLGLAASGGVYATGQVAFHYKDDTSLREIPTDVDTKELRATHFAYDLSDARTDPNIVTPQYQDEADRRLAEEGGPRPCPVC